LSYGSLLLSLLNPEEQLVQSADLRQAVQRDPQLQAQLVASVGGMLEELARRGDSVPPSVWCAYIHVAAFVLTLPALRGGLVAAAGSGTLDRWLLACYQLLALLEQAGTDASSADRQDGVEVGVPASAVLPGLALAGRLVCMGQQHQPAASSPASAWQLERLAEGLPHVLRVVVAALAAVQATPAGVIPCSLAGSRQAWQAALAHACFELPIMLHGMFRSWSAALMTLGSLPVAPERQQPVQLFCTAAGLLEACLLLRPLLLQLHTRLTADRPHLEQPALASIQATALELADASAQAADRLLGVLPAATPGLDGARVDGDVLASPKALLAVCRTAWRACACLQLAARAGRAAARSETAQHSFWTTLLWAASVWDSPPKKPAVDQEAVVRCGEVALSMPHNRASPITTAPYESLRECGQSACVRVCCSCTVVHVQ
jgi:hypothetical protein